MKTRNKKHRKNKTNAKNTTRKYPSVCNKSMSFGECELALLRESVDKIQKKTGRQTVKDPEIKDIIKIVEDFLKKKKLICYGGTAINNILPKEERFYDLNVELPDYDMYSPDALKHSIQLADLYYKNGYKEVEAKPGIHPGTYKVFVNFIPIADITNIPPELFKALSMNSKSINKIHYAPVNYLRMSMYNELSRPKGDTTRWEKVMKRLTLLNKHFPLKGDNCDKIDIQRAFDNTEKFDKDDIQKIFKIARDVFIEKNCVFFGAMASRLYLKYYMDKKNYNKLSKIPDFDIISEEPLKIANYLKQKLDEKGFNNIILRKHSGTSDIVPEHIEVIVEGDTIAFIYEPLYCHSYNDINHNNKTMRIASIDTMLNFYLSFLYLDREYYDKDRILCMSEFLFKVQQKNRLKQKGILKRFSIKCYGEPITIQKIRSDKNKLYKTLKKRRITPEFIRNFLRYTPGTILGKKIKRQFNKERKTKKR